MWLKYLGFSGPNGEQKDEIREYSEEEGKTLLHIFPHHFVIPTPDEIPQKGKKKA